MNRKVSLKDVAQHVGVSIALVSYVVNNRENEIKISPETLKQIRAAIKELGYQPNQVAKSLKHGKTFTIGLIVADISNPFFSAIARIIEDEAKKHGYVVIFGSNEENSGKSAELIDVLINRQVDAFIIAPAAGSEDQIKELQKTGVPFVLIDRYFKGIKADSVVTNNHQAAFDGVKHLVKYGRKKIAMIAYDTYLEHMQERIKGYKDGLKTHKIAFNSNWLKFAKFNNIKNDVGTAIDELLKKKEKIDALFFTTNSLAVEGIKKLISKGIKIPDDIAIISFDENDAFDLFYSPVTYISQSIEEMGKKAIELVIAGIKNPGKKVQTVTLKVNLIARKSCGE